VYTGETHSSVTKPNTVEDVSTTLWVSGIPYSTESHCFDSIRTAKTGDHLNCFITLIYIIEMRLAIINK